MISITNIIAFRGLRDSGGDSGGGGGGAGDPSASPSSDTISGGGGSDFSGGVGNDSLGSYGGGSGGFWSSLATDLGSVFNGTATSPYSAADVSFANNMAAAYGRNVSDYLPGGQYGPGGGSYSSIGLYGRDVGFSPSLNSSTSLSSLPTLADIQALPSPDVSQQMLGNFNPFSPDTPADFNSPLSSFFSNTPQDIGWAPGVQEGLAKDESTINAAYEALGGPNMLGNNLSTEEKASFVNEAISVSDPSYSPTSSTAQLQSYYSSPTASGIRSATDFGSKAASAFGVSSPVSFDPSTGTWSEGSRATLGSVLGSPAVSGLGTLTFGPSLMALGKTAGAAVQGDPRGVASGLISGVMPNSLNTLEALSGKFGGPTYAGAYDMATAPAMSEFSPDLQSFVSSPGSVAPSQVAQNTPGTTASVGSGGQQALSPLSVMTAPIPVSSEHVAAVNPYTSRYSSNIPNNDLRSFAGGLLFG